MGGKKVELILHKPLTLQTKPAAANLFLGDLPRTKVLHSLVQKIITQSKNKALGTAHLQQCPPSPVPLPAGSRISSSYSPWGIRTAVFGAVAGCIAAAVRGPKTISRAPNSQQASVIV